MHDILHKTGPYLHAPDDLLRLRFETGGTPRLFTLLIASAIERDQIDTAASGLVLLDEDEGRVLLDRHKVSSAGGDGAEFYRIASLSWSDFSSFCRSHPRFRGGIADIDTPHEQPLPGSRRRQEALIGNGATARSPGDLRSDLMRRADTDPSCPVRFPQCDRKGVLDDLGTRILICPSTGFSHMGWLLCFPDATDLAGLSGPFRVDRSMDPAWTDLLDRRPELLEEARIRTFEALVSGQLKTWGVEDEGRYDLRPSHIGGSPTVLLYALDGAVVVASTPAGLRGIFADMSDRDLRDLWKLSRTLDHETGPERGGEGLSAALNRIRSEVESSNDPDPSPSGP